ncbi:MAG: hypothetical protein FWB88_12180 [Defluviitaleaceae bacterium]|nr:hypothetical protein [Defluviitaleaceae bacterium]MCL2240337.1 hypothetical protein [Defluviitaleaceae bacterium]
MRITNSMIFGNSLNNVHRNMRHINQIVQQIETTKRFQRPSDDPIMAARALRYRNIIEETQQFYRNVQGGLAWMHVTESAFLNMTTEILQQMNEILIKGATGHLYLDDRLGLVKELQELVDQIALEINQTYMGRHVFSGYRTTQPPVFTSDNDKSFIITQQFNARDIERIMSFQKHLNDPTHNSEAHKAIVNTAHVIKLAYNHVNFDFSVQDADGNSIDSLLAVPGIRGAYGRNGEPPFHYEIVVRSLMDRDAYTPPGTGDGSAGDPFIVHFIQETGEIVLCDEAMRTFRDGTTVTFHKEGFRKGELNPWIYFDVVEITGRDESTNAMISGEIVYQHEDWIVHEISPGEHQRINDIAPHVYTDKMYTDLKRLLDFVRSIKISDRGALEAYFEAPPHELLDQALENAISTQLAYERSQANSVLQDRFSHMIRLMERHSDNVIAEHARLGTRMSRFEMVEVRLSENEVHMEELLLVTTGTNPADAITRKVASEAALQAAMRAIAMTVQLSLVNFLR